MLKKIQITMQREALEDVLYLTDDLKLLHELLQTGKKAAAVLTEKNRTEDFSGIPYALEQIEELEIEDYERIYRRLAGLCWEILETSRCRLREMTQEDLEALYEIYAGEGITQYMEGLYENPEKEREYIRDYIKYVYAFYEYGMWIVEEKETGRIIGRAGIEPMEGKNELGYVIGRPWQRQGYAYEVCQAVLEYMQQRVKGCEEISSRVHIENAASIALLEKLGFECCEQKEGMRCYRLRLSAWKKKGKEK